MKKYNLLAGLLLGLAFQTAQAKVALVIGNDDYSGNTFPSLNKAVSDAHTLSEKLKSLGFQVIEKKDLTAAQMRQAVIEFSDALKRDNEVGLFYYAGHGMQIEGSNYLVPVEAKISREFEAKTEAINADLVLDAMFEAKTKINIVILDACRDNQFANRGGRRGLANIARENTFIAYATQPNKTADDGTFMQYFAKRITEPLPIDQMFMKVLDDVSAATKEEQVPSFNYNLTKKFYFSNQPTTSQPSVSVATAEPNHTKLIADRYRDNGDGTVTDVITDLQWMRCSLGQVWNGFTCQGKAKMYNFTNQGDIYDKKFIYGSYNDWRVPSLHELKTLIYCSTNNPRTWSNAISPCQGNYSQPTIINKVFPETPLTWYFSATHFTAKNPSSFVQYVYFNFTNGEQASGGIAVDNSAIRLVRSERVENSISYQGSDLEMIWK